MRALWASTLPKAQVCQVGARQLPRALPGVEGGCSLSPSLAFVPCRLASWAQVANQGAERCWGQRCWGGAGLWAWGSWGGRVWTEWPALPGGTAPVPPSVIPRLLHGKDPACAAMGSCRAETHLR